MTKTREECPREKKEKIESDEEIGYEDEEEKIKTEIQEKPVKTKKMKQSKSTLKKINQSKLNTKCRTKKKKKDQSVKEQGPR